MTAAQIFSIANLFVVPFWALLIIAPGWRVTHRVVHSIVAPLILGATYIALIASGAFTAAPEGAGFSSLEGVMALFTVPSAVLAGWVHYLVFDLFVGAWEARDAKRRGFPHWLLIPCLLLTFLLGPVGLFLYLILRMILGKGGSSLDEQT